ncbi:MAG: lipopolysaccharide biosynthesis protein [Alphaproteobacteria bacterium]|nr:lipopolysaccharide biosynthesis protein [Alphaproteobacteria bacterium]MBV9370137.1 lipopolysaccharide biosynthesis protein [Alphaproteobacteria bacterium]MBV9901477.1 lipopolysaccharide biosynthesis protein [Alphaproteobacteria bacterium]
MTRPSDPGRMILRGAQATAAGFAGRLGARLLFLFVAGRLFGPAPFGAYVLAVAAVELAVSVGSLGMKKLVFQLLDGEKDPRALPHVLLGAALLVALASAALAAMLMAAALLLPPVFLPGGAGKALFLLAPMVAGQSLLDLFLAATRWRHAIRYEVVARSLVEPYALLLGAAAAWALGWRETGLLAGYWAGTLAALAFAAAGARRVFGPFRLGAWRPDPARLLPTLRFAFSNTAADLLNALYTRVDLWLVGLLLGAGPAGVYGMARQVAVPIRQVRQSFDGLLIPLVARTLGRRGSRGSGEALASATRLILAIQLPLIVALFAVGRPLLAWLGAGFEAAYWPLLALAVAEAIQAAFSIGDLVFVYLKPKVGLVLTLASIAVGIAAALLLIPPLGLAGAALSVLAAYALRAALRSVVLRAHFYLDVPHSHQAGPFAAAAAGIAAVLLAGAWPLPYRFDPLPLVLGLGLYAAVLALWLQLSRQSLSLTGFAAETD